MQMTKGEKRKEYEVKLSKLLGMSATPKQVTRIRIGAKDLSEGADWDKTLKWVLR